LLKQLFAKNLKYVLSKPIKMIIVITGDIGIGKTTVCGKVISKLKSNRFLYGGVLSIKDSGGDIKVLNLKNNKEIAFASNNIKYNGPRTNNKFFSQEGIDFGIKAIEESLDSDFLFVDELGLIELEKKGYYKVLDHIHNNRFNNIIIIIRRSLLSTYKEILGNKIKVFEVYKENRDIIPLQIYDYLVKNRE